LAKSSTACVNASFRKAGQVCTSVQRIYVQRDVVEDFTDQMVTRLADRHWGDPRQRDCFVGQVNSERDADRIESWINGAVCAGATLRHGGKRSGSCVQPTILRDVPADADVLQREVFGPVVSVIEFDEVDHAINDANATPYGLAAGIFTRDIAVGLEAARRLRMGSVHLNQTSSNRVDLMPYGGVKKSGMGLEGPRYAIEEMTELQLVTIGH
jgi:succinate-semialdehyde dehydrogenase/glutarate-semialdehyde dehydrogenase